MRSAGSLTHAAMAFERASGESDSTIHACSPSSATSGTPPTRVATTGSDTVIASRSALGIASEREGITMRSLAAYTTPTDFWWPRK